MGFQGYFNVEELPGQVKIFERTVNLEILEENLRDSVAVYGGSFLTDAYYFYVVMLLFYLNIWMQEVIQHVFFLTSTVAMELEMVNQAFKFL